VLERLAKVDGVAFDKTGTLTERHALVTLVAPSPGATRDDVLALAAAVEAESEHPIASAINVAAGLTGRPPVTAEAVRSLPGVGVVGTVRDHSVQVRRMIPDELPPPLRPGVLERFAQGETVVVVERDGLVIGAISLTTPLRPEAGAAVDHLVAMGLSSVILSGDSAPAVRSVADTLGIRDARSGLSPAGKLAALAELRVRSRRMVMVGDGVNDAPALAAADVGCAIGSGSEAALAHSDVALLGNDLEGVPAAVGVAGSTYAIIVQNFGWAMGYNVSALPLAAFGLLDPLVAAVAMGLSSIIVVLNSLRLTRVGRSGLAQVRPPRVLQGRRGVLASVALPVILFAGLTVVSQLVSPARGQSLLPDLPSISVRALPQGGSVETYLEPGRPGVNQFHLIFSGTSTDLASVDPVVTAGPVGGSPRALRQLTVGPDHYSEVVVLTPGSWRFAVATPYGTRTVSFTDTLVVPSG
jgi:soluble P-type ATPase